MIALKTTVSRCGSSPVFSKKSIATPAPKIDGACAHPPAPLIFLAPPILRSVPKFGAVVPAAACGIGVTRRSEIDRPVGHAQLGNFLLNPAHVPAQRQPVGNLPEYLNARGNIRAVKVAGNHRLRAAVVAGNGGVDGFRNIAVIRLPKLMAKRRCCPHSTPANGLVADIRNPVDVVELHIQPPRGQRCRIAEHGVGVFRGNGGCCRPSPPVRDRR